MRKRRNDHHGDLEHGVNRAMIRIQMGVLTTARSELDGAKLAPCTEATLRQLRQRPTVPRDFAPRTGKSIRSG